MIVPTGPAFSVLTLLILCAAPSALFADCTTEPPTIKEIAVKSCRTLDPLKTKRFDIAAGGPAVDDAFYLRYYQGALVTDTRGVKYVYPVEDDNPCRLFPSGKIVRKVMDSTCCDTGRWGKCIYGGRWLWEQGADPLNTFQ